MTAYAASAPQFALSNATRNFILTNNAGDGLLSFSYNSANRLQFDVTNQWFNVGNLGVGTVTPLGKIHAVSTTSGDTLIRADGTNGGLFSIIDDLSDSLMSVNTIAGLPVLEVFANNTVKAGQFNSGDFTISGNKVGIGQPNPQFKLDVSGNIRFTGISAGTSNNVLVIESNGEVRTKINASSSGSSGSSGSNGSLGSQGGTGGTGGTGNTGGTGGTGSLGSQGGTGGTGNTGGTGGTGNTGGTGGTGSLGSQGGTGGTGNTGGTGGTGGTGNTGGTGGTGSLGSQGGTGGTGNTGGTGGTGGIGSTGATGNPFGGGTFSGDVTFQGLATTQKGISDITGTNGGVVPLRLTHPGGGAYASNVGAITGAIKIRLPLLAYRSSTMMRMTVKIYLYSGTANGNSRTIDIGGYNYSAGGWYNYFAYQNSMNGVTALNVRFGFEGGYNVIWIGETNTVWDHPQIFIEDFQAGYSSTDQGRWASGWDINFVTTLGTVENGPITASLSMGSTGSTGSQGGTGGTGNTGGTGGTGNTGGTGGTGSLGSQGGTGGTGGTGNTGGTGGTGNTGGTGGTGNTGGTGGTGSLGSQGAGATVTNNVDNYVLTATGSGINGEANARFDGTRLSVYGTISTQQYSSTVNGTATSTINFALGNVLVLTLNSNSVVTLAYSNRAASTFLDTAIIVVKYAGASSTISWTSVLWPGGINPTLTNVSGRADVFTLSSYQGGAGSPVWIGTVVSQNIDSTNL